MTAYVVIFAGVAGVLAILALMFWAAMRAAKGEGAAQANIDHAKAETKAVVDAVGAANDAREKVARMSRAERDRELRQWVRD